MLFFFSNYTGMGQILCFSHSRSTTVAHVAPGIAKEELFLRANMKKIYFSGSSEIFPRSRDWFLRVLEVQDFFSLVSRRC